MTCATLLVLLYSLQVSTSDWVSEWMAPVESQLYENPDNYRRSSSGGILKQYEDEYQKMQKLIPILESSEFPFDSTKGLLRGQPSSSVSLKTKLETTLKSAKNLADALKNQITDMTLKENELKDAITHGRNGVSMITVHTLGQLPRKYIIREGVWTLCTGVMQTAIGSTSARCFGQEVVTKPDPCVFNSVIKYETIPTRRRVQYTEDNYLCLKPNFDVTLEQYLSVPKRLINETCTNGIVRSLEENIVECGVRVLSEYSYYPNKKFNTGDSAPVEFCMEQENGICKLIIAWHIANSSIDSFDFMTSEPNFKKYFLKLGNSLDERNFEIA